MSVSVQRKSRAVVAQHTGHRLYVHTVEQGCRGEGVPIGYNKDKSGNLVIARDSGLSLFFFHEKSRVKRALR